MTQHFTKTAWVVIGSLVFFLALGFGLVTIDLVSEHASLVESEPVQSSYLPSVAGSSTSSAQLVTVVKVVDGDTIKAVINGTLETVRLVGINTPESVDPRMTVECLGQEASQFLTDMLADQLVLLEADATQKNRDRYGRLLRFVFLPDGTDVGLQLLREGYAHEALYSSKPHQYRDAYLLAQQAAQSQQKGLWNPAACLGDARE